ncbi:hypothetical protein, partial [Vibrio vulnificus]|uniref:hypothetical protein n=1 Tax=Vibrio vulnificus TaxID=672 RepID=UPI003242239D
TTALTVTRDQIAGLGKGSNYLGNNAHSDYLMGSQLIEIHAQLIFWRVLLFRYSPRHAKSQ